MQGQVEQVIFASSLKLDLPVPNSGSIKVPPDDSGETATQVSKDVDAAHFPFRCASDLDGCPTSLGSLWLNTRLASAAFTSLNLICLFHGTLVLKLGLRLQNTLNALKLLALALIPVSGFFDLAV